MASFKQIKTFSSTDYSKLELMDNAVNEFVIYITEYKSATDITIEHSVTHTSNYPVHMICVHYTININYTSNKEYI